MSFRQVDGESERRGLLRKRHERLARVALSTAADAGHPFVEEIALVLDGPSPGVSETGEAEGPGALDLLQLAETQLVVEESVGSLGARAMPGSHGEAPAG
ncbi:hypothetical protein PG985_014260 [Apiospora marii]|uniref:uncharacterized protein n=1 Tax=Apiospora marii TaxID=335849 RepID=UPI003131D1CA